MQTLPIAEPPIEPITEPPIEPITEPTTELAKTPYYTPEDYFALEETAEVRHEYWNGVISEMAGGTTNHNRIARNLSAWLHVASQDEDDYENFIGDVKLWVPDHNLYTYPDVMVVVGPVEYHGDRRDIICNPTVIAEVLSQSTARHDRLTKFAMYRTIPSVQECLLINQTGTQVEHFIKQSPKRWLLQEIDQEDTQIEFSSIPVAVSLEALYRKVKFDE